MSKKFSKEIQADSDAFYMSVPEVVAKHIALQLKNYKSAVELCCAVGMMAVQLAKYIPKVTGVDIDEKRIGDAEYNAELYGVQKNTRFIVGNVLDKELLKSIKADVAILDPDWSAKGSIKSIHTSFENMQPSLLEMIKLTKGLVTPNFVSRLPKETQSTDLLQFGPHILESIYIDGKLKFKVAYFLSDIKQSKGTEVLLNSSAI